MQQYWETFVAGYSGYGRYLWHEITHPSWQNYFYWLIGVSLFFMLLEWISPWRKDQGKFRRDFWLDAFYMFFNFFLFSLIIYNAASDVIVDFFNDVIGWVSGFNLQANNPMNNWPMWAILLFGFLVRDFVQWWTHRLLHRFEKLWEWHKVHHSVKEMGFAAHLRFHWMETVVYRTIEYIPLALLGIGLYDFFIIHIFTLAVGHYNHSNISVSSYVTAGLLGALLSIPFALGILDLPNLVALWQMPMVVIMLIFSFVSSMILGPWMKYIFNSPEMHIWHHVYHFPRGHQYGLNFGLTLSIWDWLWGTADIPYDGKDIELGFPGVEKFPEKFVKQVSHGF